MRWDGEKPCTTKVAITFPGVEGEGPRTAAGGGEATYLGWGERIKIAYHSNH